MSDQLAIKMTAPPDVYRRRRANLAASLKRPLVIFAGHAPARNYPTNPRDFRAGSSYLYFGGPPIENAALLIETYEEFDETCNEGDPGDPGFDKNTSDPGYIEGILIQFGYVDGLTLGYNIF